MVIDQNSERVPATPETVMAERRTFRRRKRAAPSEGARPDVTAAPRTSAAPSAPPPRPDPAEPSSTTIAAPAIWDRIRRFTLDERHLDAQRVVTASRHDPAHGSFDILRTRLLQGLADHRWTRVGVTSATQGCGKTFTVANLALSLARQENCPAVVLDLDMRRPALHKYLGVRQPGSIGDVLRGTRPAADHAQGIGTNTLSIGTRTAFFFNDTTEAYASELLQDPRTVAALDGIQSEFAPRVMLVDLPPALSSDDVIAIQPHLDAFLIVVGGGLTTERELRDVENRLGTDTPLLGMVMNRAEGTTDRSCSY